MVLAALVGWLAVPPRAHAGVQTGVRVLPSHASSEFDSGVKVDLNALPVTFFVQSTRLSLQATIPYIQMDVDVPPYYVGPSWLRIPVYAGDRLHEEGIGDVELTPTVLIRQGDLDHPWIWAGARFKLPTGNEDKHLGNGETDYGPTAGILVPVGTRLLVLGSARYDRHGEPPDTVYNDTLVATVSGRLRLWDLSGVSLSATRAESPLPGQGPSTSMSAFYDHVIPGKDLSVYGGILRVEAANGNGYGMAVGFTYKLNPLPWGS